jgi:hypothetical protein
LDNADGSYKQAWIEPFFYRRIEFRSAQQLSAAAACFADPDRSIKVATWTRSISLCGNVQNAAFQQDLMTVLLYAFGLETLISEDCIVSYTALAIAGRTSLWGMTCLRVAISESVTASLLQIAQMLKLERMTLHVLAPRDGGRELELPADWSWTSPGLKELTMVLTHASRDVSAILLCALGHARFAVLRKFDICLANKLVPDAPMQSLRAFLTQHSALETTSLKVGTGTRPGRIYAQIIPLVRSRQLMTDVPNDGFDFIHLIRPEVTFLILEIDRGASRQIDSYFHSITKRVSEGLGLRHIQLVFPTLGPIFAWSTVPGSLDRGYVLLLGRLLYHCLTLRQSGITVVDQQGNALGMSRGLP